jgi:hypothetical protein
MSVPIDTRTIQLLTAAEALVLVEREDGIYLPNLASLTPEVADVLAKHEGPFLDLDSLSVISSEVAKSLATFEGELSLTGLIEISKEVGELLAAKTGGRIYLPENFRGTTTGAAAIVQQKGKWVAPEKVEHLEPALADVLAQSERVLSLSSLTSISNEVAQSLAPRTGEMLCLDGLTELSPDVAELIAGRPGHLSFGGLSVLKPNVARALSRHRSRCVFLSLEDDWIDNTSKDPAAIIRRMLAPYGVSGRPRKRSIRYLTKEMIVRLFDHLERHEGAKFSLRTMSVPPPFDIVITKYLALLTAYGPKSFSAGVAYIYVECDYDLYLDGVTELSDDDAAALANHPGDVFLGSLRSLTSLPLVAKLASTERDEMYLNGLSHLSPETAAALAEYNGRKLMLNGLRELTRGVAEGLSGFKGHHLSLCGLSELSPEAAAALAEYAGAFLYLDRVRALSSQSATCLAKYKGDRLFLSSLEDLSPDAACALAAFTGSQLYLDGLRDIPIETARSLSQFKGDCLCIRGIARLSAEIEDAFDEFGGKVIYTRDGSYKYRE